ncbi:MAG TPA: asparagine synthase C-terminal domain-containing protein, partial [Gammaproteobacteria bacterium]|nr:asparagine synthase C-terminal domain-containing protein [Gammaproteobacteria bacterium]
YNGWLLWASEIKALLAAGVPAEPDFKGIDYLFNFFAASTHRTFFKNIHLLPPGHFLKIKNQQQSIVQYWDLDFPNNGEEKRIDNTRYFIDEFEMLLQKAVKKRLLSDGPVVSYLSGGIDSTMILNMSYRESGFAIPTFTMGLKNVGPDERSATKETAKLFGSSLTTVPIGAKDLVNAFPELIEASEGPVLDTSCAALLLLAKEVHRQGYKVALTGEGADEALAGYLWFKTQKMMQWMNGDVARFFQSIFERTIETRGRQHGLPIPVHGIANVRPAQQYMYEVVSLARETLYSEKMWENLRDYHPFQDLRIEHARMKNWHPLNQSLYVGYKVMLPGLLLISKGDRVAMRSSVETRYPFLDEDIIHFCATIDPAYKLRGITEKWLLRKVAMKTLPPHIANRKKKSFRTNLSDIFLANDKPRWVNQLLSRESLQKTEYFNADAVLREIQLQKTLPGWLPRQLVYDAALACVISTQLWHHIFMGGGLCELPHK